MTLRYRYSVLFPDSTMGIEILVWRGTSPSMVAELVRLLLSQEVPPTGISVRVESVKEAPGPWDEQT